MVLVNVARFSKIVILLYPSAANKIAVKEPAGPPPQIAIFGCDIYSDVVFFFSSGDIYKDTPPGLQNLTRTAYSTRENNFENGAEGAQREQYGAPKALQREQFEAPSEAKEQIVLIIL